MVKVPFSSVSGSALCQRLAAVDVASVAGVMAPGVMHQLVAVEKLMAEAANVHLGVPWSVALFR
jgi:hypothetical protein